VGLDTGMEHQEEDAVSAKSVIKGVTVRDIYFGDTHRKRGQFRWFKCRALLAPLQPLGQDLADQIRQSPILVETGLLCRECALAPCAENQRF
jgi:hypothetical protein